MEVGRFAPSTTGRAHPGTLLAALLCWLDARSRGARLVLRLEDLDPERCRPEFAREMGVDLAWLGLEFDQVERQGDARDRHESALDQLAAAGLLYPCSCSRARILAQAGRAPDGSVRYPGDCRGRPLPAEGWRASLEPLRVRLPEGTIALRDESGEDLSGDPAATFGDPIVRRRDGASAYHLASVVDDAAVGVTRVVRGRDLAASTAPQARLRGLLNLPLPAHRHHLLLLERRGKKLAKLHGSVDIEALRRVYTAEALCGVLAHAAGLRDSPDPATPGELLAAFRWERVALEDRLLHWTGEALELVGSVEPRVAR
jgi:glutamyl/glutaminyl-tRNA synthetase